MYFSVKVPVKIGGKSFHTCICYALTDMMRSTVERLVKEGKAVIYTEKQFFCNGKLVEKKAVVKENLTTEVKSKKYKKSKKHEEVVKENLTTEENTDITEGF